MRSGVPASSGRAAPQSGTHVSQLTVLVDDSAKAPRSFADALEAAVSGSGGDLFISRSALGSAQSLRDASDRLAADPNARLLIVYEDPVAALSLELENGADDLRLNDWIEQAERVLEVFRRQRKQVMLVDGNAAVANPSNLAQQLVDRLGASFSQIDLPPLDNPAITMSWLIADHVIRTDQTACRLLAELRASSLPIPRGSDSEASALIAHWRNGSGMASGVEAEPPVEPSDEPAEKLKEENELLLLQLHQVQEELEHYFFSNKDLDQEVAALKQELGWKRDDIESLHNSMSWRVTAPLRKIMDLVGGGK